MPVIAIEIVTEMGLGILMRTVPQINVFMVGLQLKLLVGLVLILLVLPGIFGFIDNILEQMFENVLNGFRLMSG